MTNPESNPWRNRALSTLGAAVDRAMTVTVGARARRGQGKLTDEDHRARMQRLAEVEARYATHEFMSDAARFFPVEPEPPSVRERAVPHRSGLPMYDLRWTSSARAIDDSIRARLERDEHNRDARARWVGEAGSGRPALLLVHGYLGGDPDWELRFMPVDTLRRWGFDVALFALPFHGPRKDPARRGAPKFPSVDPAWNIEVWRQAIIELRELVAIAHRRGARSVGVLGMSLGGYTAALLAAAEPTLSVAVPLIPLASLADFSRLHGRLPGTLSEQREIHQALERAMAPVSPVSRRPVIDRQRIIVLSAEGDRITHPEHAHRLAAHTGATHFTFAGGHLLQFGRRGALSKLERELRALSVL
jgi:pimeloyl-ACP methyl ester carboxylesterase